MNWRLATIDDYEMIKSWWEHHNKVPFFPPKSLPKYSVIVHDDEYDLYCGFLYLTGTNIGWIEFIISNPLAPVKNKKGAKEKLYDVIDMIAKLNGVEVLFSSTNVKPLINHFKKNGFIETDKGVSNFIRKV